MTREEFNKILDVASEQAEKLPAWKRDNLREAAGMKTETCNIRVWDNGDKTDCGHTRPCRIHERRQRTVVPATFPCGCRYTISYPSHKRGLSYDYLPGANGVLICRHGTRWKPAWEKVGDIQSAEEEELREVIRRELCIGFCHVKGHDEAKESCRQRGPQSPTAWCEGCIRTLLHETEGQMKVRRSTGERGTNERA